MLLIQYLIQPHSTVISVQFVFILVVILSIVKLGSRSKVYLKSLIRDLDLELVAIIAMSPTTHKTFLSRITLKSLHV